MAALEEKAIWYSVCWVSMLLEGIIYVNPPLRCNRRYWIQFCESTKRSWLTRHESLFSKFLYQAICTKVPFVLFQCLWRVFKLPERIGSLRGWNGVRGGCYPYCMLLLSRSPSTSVLHAPSNPTRHSQQVSPHWIVRKTLRLKLELLTGVTWFRISIHTWVMK